MTDYYISLSYATFMISIDHDKVVNAAPIARWMIGKDIKTISTWLKSKNARVIKLEDR